MYYRFACVMFRLILSPCTIALHGGEHFDKKQFFDDAMNSRAWNQSMPVMSCPIRWICAYAGMCCSTQQHKGVEMADFELFK